ncbi:hypothetical protein F4781DRAFT_440236 [Annulohypoxylon bovei var. microspora]|nr:hypothetical protein F4781DRAFT_440236 [Annulohypoxylon bovei var. microspora]
MASEDGSNESDAEKPGSNMAYINELPFKDRSDMSINEEDVQKMCQEATDYRISLELHTEQLHELIKDLEETQEGLEACEELFNIERDEKLKTCGHSLQELQDSLENLRHFRLEIEHNASAKNNTPEQTTSQPPPQSMLLSPKELHDLRLDDLINIICTQVAPIASNQQQQPDWKSIHLLMAGLNCKDTEPTPSSLPAPIRKWMSPKQLVKQHRKNTLAIPRVRNPAISRKEWKNKQLDMRKASKRHRSLRRKALVVGRKLVYRLIQEKNAIANNHRDVKVCRELITFSLPSYQKRLKDRLSEAHQDSA